jgi:alkylation response protein AidB-like acyl-CoA dehydrogenase
MDFDLSEEQRMFKDAIRNFAEKEIAHCVRGIFWVCSELSQDGRKAGALWRHRYVLS